MKKIALIVVLLTLSACDQMYEDLKSPCVGIEKSPCARQPINEGIV